MRRLVVLALIALFLAGCGSEDQPSPAGGGGDTGQTTTEKSGGYDY